MNNDWIGETITRLDEGIYIVPASSHKGCNVFILKGQHKNVMIDVGMPSNFNHIVASLRHIGLTLNDIHLAILTHEHVDHIGGVPLLPKHVVIAAHTRAAGKITLDDQFVIMGHAFGSPNQPFHVDIHLEDGVIIDLGGLKLRVLHTPGHCSGAICLYEKSHQVLFTGDTVFAEGVLAGIFASGNITDYIGSLSRLRELNVTAMYPGHGRMSTNPSSDLERALLGSEKLLADTRRLFDSVNMDGPFRQILRQTAIYSRHVSNRRKQIRVPCTLAATVRESRAETNYAVTLNNVSIEGARLDCVLPFEERTRVLVVIDQVGVVEALVQGHERGYTRLLLLPTLEQREAQTKLVDQVCASHP